MNTLFAVYNFTLLALHGILALAKHGFIDVAIYTSDDDNNDILREGFILLVGVHYQ